MPQASILVNTVLQRLRDPQGVTSSRATVRQVMTAAQRALNMKRKWVLADGVLATLPFQIFYSIRPFLPLALDVRAVRSDNRDLHRVDWHQFWYYKRNWHRVVENRFKLFSMVGKELLIVWPAKAVASTVDVIYPVQTNDLEELTDIQIPDEGIPMLLDLTHAVLTIGGRNFAPLKSILEALAARVKAL